MQVTFKVMDMACQHCVSAINEAVNGLAGVQQVTIVLDSHTVTVEHTPDTTAEAIAAAINGAGYEEVSRV